MSSSFSDFPSDFDPTVWDPPGAPKDPQSSYSEDLAAIEEQAQEQKAENNRRGIVIQRRAYTLRETFLSDDDHLISSPTRNPAQMLASSPPMAAVMLENGSAASPSPSSKRIRLDGQRSPLKPLDQNVRRRGGFMLDDSDDEEPQPELVHKRPFGVPVQPPAPLHTVKLFSGTTLNIAERKRQQNDSDRKIAASKSAPTITGARDAYYGVNMRELLREIELEDAKKQAAASPRPAKVVESVEPANGKKHATKLWTEKYRARKFTDIVGDERTNRSVLHWLKSWDPVVFPRSKAASSRHSRPDGDNEKKHRKVLLLTGPPGLGKTTLAHVCARQAGYEGHEINASDDRTANVVRGRIRDMVGTENVRGVRKETARGVVRKAGKPVCVIVDEVDGVANVGGDGGFVKALIDLVHLDERNSNPESTSAGSKKKDRFRMMRPLILICNDLYHPTLRPLRQSNLAEIVYVRKPPIASMSARLKSIFESEGVPCDADGVRRLCEATWGVSGKRGQSGGTTEGDMRSVLVVGEWVASRFRSLSQGPGARLSKLWLEQHILSELGPDGGAARLCRGTTREVVDRVFLEDAGFAKTADGSERRAGFMGKATGTIGVAEAGKRSAMHRLRGMIDASGEIDRIVSDCYMTYPTQPFQDDNFLTKPNRAAGWLHFYDQLSTRVSSSQDWEVAPYLSSAVLAFHHLFAVSPATRAFEASGARFDGAADDATPPLQRRSAPYTAYEAQRANAAAVAALQSQLSLPLQRLYTSRADTATELLPYVLRLLAPAVTPVVITTSSGKGGASVSTASVRRADEKERVGRAVECMLATGVRFERSKVESEDARGGGWVYRMEPALDGLAAFEGFEGAGAVRYAVRQVLEGEFRRRDAAKRNAGVIKTAEAKQTSKPIASKEDGKKDFFGRVVKEKVDAESAAKVVREEGRVWVSYHEGFSNAVRRPVTLEELMGSL